MIASGLSIISGCLNRTEAISTETVSREEVSTFPSPRGRTDCPSTRRRICLQASDAFEELAPCRVDADYDLIEARVPARLSGAGRYQSAAKSSASSNRR
jgi:hypothetical protein